MRQQPRPSLLLAPLFALVTACDKAAPPAPPAPPVVAAAATPAASPVEDPAASRRPRAEPEPAPDPGLKGTEASPEPSPAILADADVAPADAAAPAAAAPETPPAAEAAGGAEAVAPPAFPTLGLAACDRYIRAAEGCLGRVPDSQRMTQRAAFEKLVASWQRQLQTQGAAVEPALELGCKAAFEQARESFGTLCPDYVWR
jgi:hypothetical protein